MARGLMNPNLKFSVKILINMYGAGQERDTTVSLQKSAKHGGGSVML